EPPLWGTFPTCRPWPQGTLETCPTGTTRTGHSSLHRPPARSLFAKKAHFSWNVRLTSAAGLSTLRTCRGPRAAFERFYQGEMMAKKQASKPAKGGAKGNNKKGGRPMSRSAVLGEVAEKTDLPRKKVAEVFDVLTEIMTREVSSGGAGQFKLPTGHVTVKR